MLFCQLFILNMNTLKELTIKNNNIKRTKGEVKMKFTCEAREEACVSGENTKRKLQPQFRGHNHRVKGQLQI